MPSRKLEVQIVGDSASLERAFSRSSKSAKGFSKSLQGASSGASATGLGAAAAFARVPGPAAAAAIAIGIASKGFKDSVASASALNEQISKSRLVFGQSSAEIERWSKTTAASFGIARSEALSATGTFGNLFNTVGITGDKAGAMSRTLVELAADLASFNDVLPTEALDALRSGLVGEAEPLRRFGVLLSEAAVQQRAMADTGKTSAASLTQQEKALARYEIILRDTKTAQGNFALTSGELANQQRELKARLADTQAEIGQKLLPVVLRATEGFNGLIDAVQGVETSVDSLNSVDFRQKFADVFGIDELRRVLGELAPQLAGLQQQFIKDIQGIPLTVPKATPKETPSFGEPGFKTGKGPRVPLGPSVELRNRFFDNALTRAIDRAGDGTLEQQLGKLAKVSAMLTRRIAATKDITRKLNLEDQLVSVGRQRTSIQDQISGALEQRLEDAKADKLERLANLSKAREEKNRNLLNALQLGVDKAQITKPLGDDIAALNALRAGIQKQIAAGGDVVALQGRLLTVTQEIASAREEIATNTRAALQGRQFVALGLNAEGGDRVPGVENLRKQLSSLTERLGAAPTNVSSKLQARLAGVRKVLSGELGKATVETRERIRDLFATIRSEFDQGAKDGPLTNTTSLDTSKLLDGMGLSRDLEKQLRSRLSSFNSAGLALAGSRGGQFGQAQFGQAPIVVESHTTIQMDGDVVSRSVTRSQQKTKRRNPRQKRGPNRGV